jgi:hypothetical protein
MLIYLKDLQIVTSRYTQLCSWFLIVGLAMCIGSDKFSAVFDLIDGENDSIHMTLVEKVKGRIMGSCKKLIYKDSK